MYRNEDWYVLQYNVGIVKSVLIEYFMYIVMYILMYIGIKVFEFLNPCKMFPVIKFQSFFVSPEDAITVLCKNDRQSNRIAPDRSDLFW